MYYVLFFGGDFLFCLRTIYNRERFIRAAIVEIFLVVGFRLDIFFSAFQIWKIFNIEILRTSNNRKLNFFL